MCVTFPAIYVSPTTNSLSCLLPLAHSLTLTIKPYPYKVYTIFFLNDSFSNPVCKDCRNRFFL